MSAVLRVPIATSFWSYSAFQHGAPQGCGEEGRGCAENQGHLSELLVALKISVAAAALAFGSMIQLLATVLVALQSGRGYCSSFKLWEIFGLPVFGLP